MGDGPGTNGGTQSEVVKPTEPAPVAAVRRPVVMKPVVMKPVVHPNRGQDQQLVQDPSF